MTPTGTSFTTATCCARAALAGNPSDMYGGAVVATPLSNVRATVSVDRADTFVIDGVRASARTTRELADLVAAPDGSRDRPLVAAAIVALARAVGDEIAPLRASMTTEIPRSVGLAGSSAIVIATIRSVAAHVTGANWAPTLVNDPVWLASIALSAERDLLGIAAGMQDRLVQAYESTVFMEFAGAAGDARPIAASDVTELGDPPGVWFVACRPDTAGDSDRVHRSNSTPPESFHRKMASLGDAARSAARAIRSGDVRALRAAVDATFDLRAASLPLDPAHVEMVELARSCGAAATYTGSGGAVAVLADDEVTADRAGTRLRALGCVLLPLGGPLPFS